MTLVAERFRASKVTVYLGTLDRSQPEYGRQIFTSSRIINHNQYTASSFNNDIALVVLPSPAILSGEGNFKLRTRTDSVSFLI
jgi:Trypsin